MKKLLPLFAAACLGVAWYFYGNRTPPELVLTGIVTTGDVIVAPQIAGRVEQLLVKEGETVTRGQRLAVLAPDELRAEHAYATSTVESVATQTEQARAALRFEELQLTGQVRQAEATLAATEAQQAAAVAELEASSLDLERAENLSKEGVATAQQLDEARTKHEANRARVDALRRMADANRAAIALAQTGTEQIAARRSQVATSRHLEAAAEAQQAKAEVRLTYADVKAPMDAIVDVLTVREGEVLVSGQPMLTLINPDDLWVRADVEETYIDRVRIGDQMTVRLPSGAEITGVVFHRGADAAFATQRDVSRTKRDIKTFEIRLRCDNHDRRLAVGMTAYVVLPLAASQP